MRRVSQKGRERIKKQKEQQIKHTQLTQGQQGQFVPQSIYEKITDKPNPEWADKIYGTKDSVPITSKIYNKIKKYMKK